MGKGKTSFHVKRSFPLPQTPSLFKKSGVLFYLLLSTFVGNRAFFYLYWVVVSTRVCQATLVRCEKDGRLLNGEERS